MVDLRVGRQLPNKYFLETDQVDPLIYFFPFD